MTTAIPQEMRNNLLSGGTNISFPFYDWNPSEITRFKAALPEMKAKGIRHVRITISMNSWEDAAKTGKLREDRWSVILDFALALIELGMTPILDNHNTGIRGDDGVGDWESDYMGDLRNAPVRTRHIALMKAVATKIQNDARLVNTVVLTPANEPIFWGGAAGEPSVWWNHQKNLIPAMRSVAPDVMITYMAQDWNGIEAFVNNWNTQMKVFAAPGGVPDPRLIADCHFYEPVEGFTHVGNSNAKYPGTMTTWRGTLLWNKAKLRELIEPLSTFAKAQKLPLVLISEYGTDKRVDKESRLRYMRDLADLFREFGFGHSAYTWSYGDSFQMNVHDGFGDDRLWEAVTEPIGTPPVDPPDDPPPPPPPPPPVETDALSAEERADVLLLINAAVTAATAGVQAKLDAAHLRITELETRLSLRGDSVAAAVRKFADEVDLT